MRRAILKLGDKTTAGGTVLEGIDCCMHHGTPITFIGAQIWCPQCHSTGRIGWKGPHRIATMMGKQQALEGDICICMCDPPPVCLASQHDSFHVFTAEEVANYGKSRTASAAAAYGASVLQAGMVGRFGGNLDQADDHDEDEDESPYPAPVANNDIAADCSYFDGTKQRIDAPADFYKHTNTVRVSPGRQSTHEFLGGGMGPATEYDATINGHPVSIFTPHRSPAVGSAMVDENTMAKALETIPPQQYEHLHSVAVNSSPYSEDAYWKNEYDNPAFYSGANASIDKGINFYPWNGWAEISQQYVDSTMLHESGHLWTEAHWKDPSLKQGWLDAMESDGQAPSQYARSNANEDFAESANMYWSSKGTPCEAEGRKRYPARYRYFDLNVK